jgi:hypothetical protein
VPHPFFLPLLYLHLPFFFPFLLLPFLPSLQHLVSSSFSFLPKGEAKRLLFKSLLTMERRGPLATANWFLRNVRRREERRGRGMEEERERGEGEEGGGKRKSGGGEGRGEKGEREGQVRERKRVL